MEEDSPNSQETYLYISFGNKIKEEIFQTDFFFRMANLGTETPLVQLNDHLFKGRYEDCVGTNIFFKDVDVPRVDSVFEEESSIRLEPSIVQFKTLALTPVKIPSKMKDIPEPEYDVEINVEHDYEGLLKKFAEGSLNLEDNMKIVPKGSGNKSSIPETIQTTTDAKTLEIHAEETGSQTDDVKNTEENLSVLNVKEDPPEICECVENKVQIVDILLFKYEKLKKLARRPNRRKIEPQLVAECESKYQKAYEYNSIKSQIMMPSDYFPVITKEFNRETLVGAVNIDRSVLHGIIPPSSKFYRILSESEKTALLSMENLHNLSMPARYWVLKTQLEHLESKSNNLSVEEVSRKDEYGRTIEETIGIYKRLIKVLNGIVEEKYFYNSEAETDDGDSDDNLVMDINNFESLQRDCEIDSDIECDMECE